MPAAGGRGGMFRFLPRNASDRQGRMNPMFEELALHGTELEITGKTPFFLDDPETANPIVIKALVEAGAEVQFVSEVRHSLEDVYLSVINTK